VTSPEKSEGVITSGYDLKRHTRGTMIMMQSHPKSFNVESVNVLRGEANFMSLKRQGFNRDTIFCPINMQGDGVGSTGNEL